MSKAFAQVVENVQDRNLAEVSGGVYVNKNTDINGSLNVDGYDGITGLSSNADVVNGHTVSASYEVTTQGEMVCNGQEVYGSATSQISATEYNHIMTVAEQDGAIVQPASPGGGPIEPPFGPINPIDPIDPNSPNKEFLNPINDGDLTNVTGVTITTEGNGSVIYQASEAVAGSPGLSDGVIITENQYNDLIDKATAAHDVRT